MLKRQNSYELHEMGSRLGMNAIDVPEDKGSPAASARNLKSTPARKSFGKDKAARHGGNRMRQTIVDGMAVMGALPKAAHRVRWGMTLKGAENNHSRAMEAEEVFDQFLDSFRKRISKAVAALQVSGAFAGHGSAAERLTDNCNVGYVDDRGVVVMDRKMALKNYFQTWALIDIVSSVPIDRVMDAATEGKEDGGGVMGSKKILKLLRLVRMTKLVKLLRASQLVKKIRENLMAFMEFYKIFVSDATLKLWRLFFMMLTLSHWGSCLMFILLKAYKYPYASWAVRWDVVAPHTGVPVKSVLHCYTWGIYKTLMLVLGQAYQEFPTAQVCESSHGWCVIESWMTLVGVFAGCFFNAIFVSTITSILVSMDVSMQEFEEQLQRTNDYMRSLRLPGELRDRIRDYYHHRWKEGVIFDESLILERLNPELCLEILNYKIRDLVPKVPLLRTTPKAFSEALAPALHPTVTTEGDVVLKEGDYGDAMYFIDKGLAEVLVEAVGDQVVKLIATLLHLNAHLNEGTAGLMSTDDDEDARTPLFVSLAAKHRAEQAGTVAARVRHSLANIYQKGSSMVGGGSMTNGTRSSRASNRAASQRAGGPSSKHVMVQPGSTKISRHSASMASQRAPTSSPAPAGAS
ncbi:voltage-gated potassium channel [Aureococcus anophagefferens]|nr:voltage-gated potassium channel [Aureococcus anophagefferens]